MLRQFRLGLCLLFCGTSSAGKCVNPTALEHEISNFETNIKYNSAANYNSEVCFSPIRDIVYDKIPTLNCSDRFIGGELVNYDSCKLCDPARRDTGSSYLSIASPCKECFTGEQVSKSFVVPADTVVVVDRITHWLERALIPTESCNSVFSMSAASSSPFLKMSSLSGGYKMFNGPFVLLEGATLTSATTSYWLYDFSDNYDSAFPGIDDYNQNATRTACTTRVEVIARSYDLTDYMNGDVCY
jgi:hypothetical protein